jgi:N-acetylmuramoyl-L-alanine amidase
VFTLSNPERVVIDLDDAQSRVDLKSFSLSEAGIQQVRTGHPKPGVFRVVFDMTRPVTVKSFLVPQLLSREVQLVVDIFSVSKKPNPVVAKVIPQKLPQKIAAKLPEKTVVTTAKITKLRRVIIAIDAGHGGKDPGTTGLHGAKEKNIVLSIALQLAALINKEPNMHAVLTRSGDYFMTLRGRLAVAHQNKADILIAIHADAYVNDQQSGVSVYALSHHGATSEAARWLAKRENISAVGGVDLGDMDDQSVVLRSVLIDLEQTATIRDSLWLGTAVLSALENVTKLHDIHVEQAPFVVLKSPDIPSILVETGFLSNPREEARLSNKAYQSLLAHALLSGIQAYLVHHPIAGAASAMSVKGV